MKKFRPISFSTITKGKFSPKVFQQNLLLKALRYTNDLNDLKKVAHFHTEAEVLRTLDKLAIRKEYHEALAKNGMGPDAIVAGIKDVALTADKAGDRLKAYTTILKSLGLDTYDTAEEGGKDWEEILLKINDREREDADKLLASGGTSVIEGQVYEVKIPEIPESVRVQKEKDKSIEQSIYD